MPLFQNLFMIMISFRNLMARQSHWDWLILDSPLFNIGSKLAVKMFGPGGLFKMAGIKEAGLPLPLAF